VAPASYASVEDPIGRLIRKASFIMTAKSENVPSINDQTTWGIGTQCVQGGFVPEVGGPRILPIYQTASYKFEDVDQVGRLFSLEESGYKYIRTGNPTFAAFEQKVALLEGGVGAISTASGQSAVLLAVSNLVKAGDHIVSAKTIYGGSYVLFGTTLKKLGVETTFIDPEAPAEELRKAFRPNTRLLFGETIGNPALDILDFDKLSGLAREFDLPFIVDNTLASPYLTNPLKHGADIVIHSATKYIGGQATSLGGVVVDGGTYQWDNGKFPDFVEPDRLYANTSYWGKFGKAAFIAKARAQYLRDFGVTISPFNAFLLNLGLETLHLRMPRHSSNALALAQYLKGHPQVNWVNYPGLEDHRSYGRIAKYFNHKGASGVLTFGLKGGIGAIRPFVKALKIASLVVHVGDARTMVLHPASSTHAQLSREERLAAGIPDDMIRVSVGIEDEADILRDFEQALQAARKE
jgi:O-acetylhomoserine (thiol)-lyase